MTLYINTTDFKNVVFALSDGKKIQKKAYVINPQESHETLGKFSDFLKKTKITHPETIIKKIIVNKGPGSYTGVRVGVAIAKALGFAWGAPVQAVSAEKFVLK